jgi:hypothetical protein
VRALLVLALASVLAVTGVALAASPRGGTSYQQHRHNTGGHDWHVQFEVNNKETALKTLVVYSQQCHDTGFVTHVKLGDDYSFVVDKQLPDKKGTWHVDATFTNSSTAVGTWSLTRGDCTDGREFTAGNGKPMSLGLQNEYPPADRMATGPGHAAHALRHIKNQALASSEALDTLAKARANGYILDRSTSTKCPGFHHARKNGTGMWGNILDPEAPQALVFWCDSHRRFTLAAYMFRAPVRPYPKTYNDLMQWHRHGVTKSYLWMAHLWLVRDSAAAWATCAPFNALEDERVLRYETPAFVGAHADPCSDTHALDDED